MPVTEFTGVTEGEARGATSRGGLYEFWTEDSVHVYLHDADFSRLTYQPSRPPVLELEFAYGREPTVLAVIFRFEDVRIVEWREDQEGHDCVTTNPEAPPGQVDLFDWDGADLFGLYTFTLFLAFSASRAEVTVRAR